jgi:hypothetical protein
LIEIVAVEIFTKDCPLIMVSCYKPPADNKIDRKDWTRFFVRFEGLLVIGGGFIAHNTEWVEGKFVETDWRSPRVAVCMI